MHRSLCDTDRDGSVLRYRPGDEEISLPTDCASAVVQVLRWLLDMLPRAPAVAAFMVDFEAALWQALYKEFPDASIKGCVIHFAQANILA